MKEMYSKNWFVWMKWLRIKINLYEGNVFQELICMNEMIENKNTFIFMQSMCLLYIQITLLKRGYSWDSEIFFDHLK